MNMLIDRNIQETNPVKLQKAIRQNVLKTFECPQCGLTFDRVSQMGYHYRSIHLGERSQICQICGKGFFRKADLRTHLNTHLGTNICICEVCGRQFNHISNLIRHCRMHAGIKPYLCTICDRRFTQISSLVRHKRIIHGIPKETIRQYCNPSLINNKLQDNSYASKENEIINNVKNKCHEKIYTELRCQNIDMSREPDIEKADIIFSEHNTNMDNKAITTCVPLEAVVYIASEQFKESNLAETENVNRLSQDYLTSIEEKLRSIDLSMGKAIVLDSLQDTANNQEQIQSKDNIIYLHQLDENSFTFLPQDRDSNTESQTRNDEFLRSSDSDTQTARDFKEASINDKRSLNTEMNLRTCNSSEVSIDKKFLPKQICKEVLNENRKCDKPLTDDNQLYIELSELGLLKFDESRYCSNTDSVSMNLNHEVKSQHSTSIAANDLIHTSVTAQEQENLQHNEENLTSLTNSSNNVVLNDEEPMLRLVQTETGEQFYEFIISDLIEENAIHSKNLEDKTEKSPNNFEHCQRIGQNPQENNEKSNQTKQQQTSLGDLADINNEFNYPQFDFHREEKNFAVLCHNGPNEHFQQSSNDNECASSMQEKNIQACNPSNLELLENESHVDFDKYVEMNLEVFERSNYEICSERFFEFVEIADIESSGCNKESSMVCLIQNDGEQLLELLQDSQVTEQQQNQDFTSTNNDEDCSNTLQNNNKIVDCSKGKSDLFTYNVENNVSLEENLSSDQHVTENNKECTDNDNYLHIDLIIKESISKNCIDASEELKKLKVSPKKFQCSVCRKTFSTAYNYKQHIGIHFTDQQKFHCKKCGMSFAWKSTLNKHIANFHNSDGPQKFVCEICPRVYSTLSQVNEHVKRDHLKQRNHICLHCGKSFFKSFDLKTHSRTHTNERPYVCRVCGKRFHHQSHIIRHERTHSGKRPYVCDVCQKTFMQPSSLKAHKQKHRQIRMDILDYQIDEDDPIALVV